MWKSDIKMVSFQNLCLGRSFFSSSNLRIQEEPIRGSLPSHYLNGKKFVHEIWIVKTPFKWFKTYLICREVVSIQREKFKYVLWRIESYLKTCRDEIFLEHIVNLLRTWGTIYKAMKTRYKLLLQITLPVGMTIQIICDITILKCQYLKKNYLKSFTRSTQTVKNLAFVSNFVIIFCRWLLGDLAIVLRFFFFNKIHLTFKLPKQAPPFHHLSRFCLSLP